MSNFEKDILGFVLDGNIRTRMMRVMNWWGMEDTVILERRKDHTIGAYVDRAGCYYNVVGPYIGSEDALDSIYESVMRDLGF